MNHKKSHNCKVFTDTELERDECEARLQVCIFSAKTFTSTEIYHTQKNPAQKVQALDKADAFALGNK